MSESYREQITREFATGEMPPSSAKTLLRELDWQQVMELDREWHQYREQHSLKEAGHPRASHATAS